MPYSPSEVTRRIQVEAPPTPPPSWWEQLQQFVGTLPGGWLTVAGLALAGVLGVVGVAAYQEQQKQWWMALK